MGRKEDVWSDEQVRRLKDIYAEKTWTELKNEFRRDDAAIRKKANHLGLTRGRTKGWTEDEDKLLREEFFGKLPRKELAKKLGRSWVAVLQRAHKLGLRKNEFWTEEELGLLKENYESKSFPELERMLGRTERAIKYAVWRFELGVYKKKRWSYEEKKGLMENRGLKPGEMVGERSQAAVSQMALKVRGTAKRLLRNGWDIPSDELAYLLGCICSDASVLSSGLVMSVHPKDAEFADEFARCAQMVFGLTPRKSMHTGSWMWNDEKLFGDYYVVGVYSVLILPALGTKEGIEVGNIRGKSREWIDFLEEKFPWVWDDPWFWRFMGGLYDGDGFCSEGGVSIGVVPLRSRKRLMEELGKRSFAFSSDKTSIYVNGGHGEKERFIGSVRNTLARKRIIEGTVVVGGSGMHVVKVPMSETIEFLQRYHYLKALPGSCVTYGVVEDDKLIGIGAFSVCGDEVGMSGLELRRFALVDWTETKASSVLSRILGECKKEHPDVGFVKTFADQAHGHVGTIYQATNAVYLGQGGLERVLVAKDGRRYSGRFADKKMLKEGVSVEECAVEMVPGKHKYAYVWSDTAKMYFAPFALAFPKKAIAI